MKYYLKDGKEIVENGRSKVRVQTMFRMPSPIFKDSRTVRVMGVLEVITKAEGNAIEPGHHIALSFPNEKINAKEYEWKRSDKFEEKQVPFTVKDPPKRSITR